MSDTTPQLRVGDAERRVVDDRLMAAVGDGVLTLAEYDERSAVLWQCRTRSELAQLTADLPSEQAGAPVVPPDAPRPQRLLAVMSEERCSGQVLPGQEVTGWAVMGKAVVDLRREDLPDGVHVRVRSVMGEVEVQVPPGTRVQLTGMAVMGERKVQVAPGAGPLVHVDAYALMGSVKVTVGDGSVLPATATAGARPGAGTPAPLPAQRSSAAPVPTDGAPVRRRARRGPVRRARGRLGGLLVPVAVLGAVLVAGPDSASVFGSSVTRVGAGDTSVQVSTLFGSVDVVVPDGVQVRSNGLVVFGSNGCEGAACTAMEGDVVDVTAYGAFGSVTVWTVSEWESRPGEDVEDLLEEQRELLEEQGEG